MTITAPGGPYPGYVIQRAAPLMAMTMPVDLDRIIPGRAYWLSVPDVMGLTTPEQAAPIHVIQQVRMYHIISYMDLAAWLDLHPLDLAAWMDGELEQPSGPAWDLLVSLLAARPRTISTQASPGTRMLWRNHSAAPEDEQIMAALYNAALDDAGAPQDALGAFTVNVDGHVLELHPLPTAAIDHDNVRAYIALGFWCAFRDNDNT